MGQTPPPWTVSQTGVKTLPWPRLRLRAVKIRKKVSKPRIYATRQHRKWLILHIRLSNRSYKVRHLRLLTSVPSFCHFITYNFLARDLKLFIEQYLNNSLLFLKLSRSRIHNYWNECNSKSLAILLMCKPSCMKSYILQKWWPYILQSLTELRYSFVSGKYRDRILFNVLVASDVPPQTPWSTVMNTAPTPTLTLATVLK